MKKLILCFAILSMMCSSLVASASSSNDDWSMYMRDNSSEVDRVLEEQKESQINNIKRAASKERQLLQKKITEIENVMSLLSAAENTLDIASSEAKLEHLKCQAFKLDLAAQEAWKNASSNARLERQAESVQKRYENAVLDYNRELTFHSIKLAAAEEIQRSREKLEGMSEKLKNLFDEILDFYCMYNMYVKEDNCFMMNYSAGCVYGDVKDARELRQEADIILGEASKAIETATNLSGW